MSFDFLRRKEFVGLVILVAIFVVLHVFAINIPYHQDEYKWVFYSHPELSPAGTIPHPPLTEFIYTKFGPLVGDNNFRLIPSLFGLINLFLIFYLTKVIFGPSNEPRTSRVALWVAFLFSTSFFSLLASSMVDVDGAIMPFFFLIMTIGYYELRKTSFQFLASNSQSWLWLVLLIIGAVGGFLTKMSGVLPIAAFALDFAIIKGFFADKKKFLKFIGLGAGLSVGVILVLLLAKLVFPFFPIEKSITYWKHFANSSSFIDRGWLQTFIQFVKAILYTSPFLLAPLFFVDKEIWQKTKLFFFFIFIGLFFYLFVFDFSIGALDRYFQFLIVPLCLISGAIFAKYLNHESGIIDSVKRKETLIVLIISVIIFKLQFLNHFVPSLYPKTEWISRIFSLKWNFLYPFSGGSGPLPFYVSFLFMALVWILSLILVGIGLGVKNVKRQILFGILILGILYNGVFIEEYLFGKINGNAKNLVFNSVSFIAGDKTIKKVAVYNDNGGFEVRKIGKYERRIYATPQFEDVYIKFFENFSGHVLFIDIPQIDKYSMYADYFNSCQKIYEKKDKYITAKILDCRK